MYGQTDLFRVTVQTGIFSPHCTLKRRELHDHFGHQITFTEPGREFDLLIHFRSNPVSQVIAAWPPLALLLTVELISRVPVHRRSLAAIRLGATTAIAGIAAWVSYWHMAGVAARYGETGASPYLLPLSVDGLVIVASVSLVELAGRVRAATDLAERAPSATGAEAVTPRSTAPQPSADAAPRPPLPRSGRPASGRPAQSGRKPGTGTAKRRGPAPQQRRPVAETAALAARIEAERPDVTPDELAAQLGISTSRLRAIRREVKANQTDPDSSPEPDMTGIVTPRVLTPVG